jgi:N4-gp56 family major capsid protein
MAQTTSDALSAAITFKVQSKVLANLRGRLIFADPAFAEKGSFSAGTDTLMFVSYPDLALATTPLTEGSAPTAKALTQNVVTVSTQQFGDVLNLSDVAKVKAPVDLADIAAERITRQAAESIDKISRDAIALGGTPVYQSGDTTRAGLASTDYLTAADVMGLRAKMIAAKIPLMADGMYKLIVHPYTALDLRSEAVANAGAWMDVNRYSNPSQIMKGEVGSYHGFHVIEVPNAPTFSSTTTVYASFALGDIKGWGAGELQSLSVKHVPMGGDHSDILAQSELFGWKINFGVAPLNNSYYYRMEHATSLGSA